MSKPSRQDFGTHGESAFPELWDGVVGAWAPCLGPTGSRLHDLSGRSNWGALTNMDPPADWVVSDGQYALDFDGSNDYVRAGSGGFVGLSAITISAWVRVASTTQVMFVNATPTNTIFNFFVFSNQFNLRGGSATSLAVGVPVGFTNNWRHVAATIAGTAGSIYYQGESIASGAVAAIGASPTGVDIGAYSDFGGGYYLSGQIAEIATWNKALTLSEIRQLYQLGRGGMYQRRRRRAIYLPQAGFQAAWATRRSQVIGGGLR